MNFTYIHEFGFIHFVYLYIKKIYQLRSRIILQGIYNALTKKTRYTQNSILQESVLFGRDKLYNTYEKSISKSILRREVMEWLKTQKSGNCIIDLQDSQLSR
jgi:hypothetical protein